jgi:type IV secretory pathway protease TraF
MSRKQAIIGAGILILAVLAAAALWHRSSVLGSNVSDVEALGLHGTTKVSRPLSKTQAERLKTHFLDIPAPNNSSTNGPAGYTDTINQVQAINRLNERQSK